MTIGARFRLDGKCVLVTGGAKGIGAAICEVFVEAGASVIVADLDAIAGKAQASKLGGEFHALDVTDSKARPC